MPKIATFTTSMGVFKAELFTEKMPITCGNFIDLANSGFYDGIHFHRCVPELMTQCGCPYAREPKSSKAGTGGPKSNTTFHGCDGKKYTRNDKGGILDEIGKENQKISNEAGTIAMANRGEPESGSSQFFINVRHNSFLDWFDKSCPCAFPVFGKVTEGYDLVERISKVPNHNGEPVEPIQMISIRVA